MGPTRFNNASNNEELNSAPVRKSAGARLEFNSSNVRSLIDGRGARALWEPAWLCTCRNPKTQAPDPLCPLCGGRGVAFMPSSEIKIVVQSQEKGVINGDLGLYDSGTAIGTTTIGSGVGFRDRITLPDILLRQSLIFDVTEARVKNGLFLTYNVNEILVAYGKGGIALVEGADFTVDYKINKIYPKAHLVGQNISINMLTQLRYYVMDFLKESRYQYTELNRGVDNALFENYPKKLLLKREDIFVLPSAFSAGTDIEERGKLIDSKSKVVDEADHISKGNTYKDLLDEKPNTGGFFGGRLNG